MILDYFVRTSFDFCKQHALHEHGHTRDVIHYRTRVLYSTDWNNLLYKRCLNNEIIIRMMYIKHYAKTRLDYLFFNIHIIG